MAPIDAQLKMLFLHDADINRKSKTVIQPEFNADYLFARILDHDSTLNDSNATCSLVRTQGKVAPGELPLIITIRERPQKIARIILSGLVQAFTLGIVPAVLPQSFGFEVSVWMPYGNDFRCIGKRKFDIDYGTVYISTISPFGLMLGKDHRGIINANPPKKDQKRIAKATVDRLAGAVVDILNTKENQRLTRSYQPSNLSGVATGIYNQLCDFFPDDNIYEGYNYTTYSYQFIKFKGEKYRPLEIR